MGLWTRRRTNQRSHPTISRQASHEDRRGIKDKVRHTEICFRYSLTFRSRQSYQRNTLRRLQTELEQLRRRHTAAAATAGEALRAISKHREQTMNLQAEQQAAEETLDTLSDALEQDKVPDDHLEILEGNLRELQEEKSVHEGSFEDSVNEIDKSRDTLKLLGEQVKAKRKSLAEAEAKVKKADAAVLKLAAERQTALYEKNEAFQRIDDAKRDREQAVNKKQAMVARVQDYTAKASRVSARVPIDPGETPESLERKLERLSHELEVYQRRWAFPFG